MSDLVNSLRERAANARAEGNATANSDARHFEASADEIERLRAVNAELVGALRDAREIVFAELRTYLECACVLSPVDLEPQRHTLSEDEGEVVERWEGKIAKIDAALAKVEGQS